MTIASSYRSPLAVNPVTTLPTNLPSIPSLLLLFNIKRDET